MNLKHRLYVAGSRLGAGKVINAVLGEKRARAFSHLFLGGSMMDYNSILSLLRANEIHRVPGDVLEIGCWRGEGTRRLLAWASMYHKAVYACDFFQYDVDPDGQRCRFNKATEDYPNLWFHDGDSLYLTDHLPDVRFCFAIVDGCHDNPQVESDLALAWERLSPGGIMLVDDVESKYPDVVSEIKAFEKRTGLQGRHGVFGHARWYRKP